MTGSELTTLVGRWIYAIGTELLFRKPSKSRLWPGKGLKQLALIQMAVSLPIFMSVITQFTIGPEAASKVPAVLTTHFFPALNQTVAFTTLLMPVHLYQMRGSVLPPRRRPARRSRAIRVMAH